MEPHVIVSATLKCWIVLIGFPTLFVEFAIFLFSERSSDFILHNVTRYFARLTQYYILCYFVALSSVLLPPLEQWVLARVLAWWYPVLGLEGVLELCKSNFWYLPIALMNTEEGIVKEKAKAKAVVAPSPFTFVFLLFILNGAIYDRAPDSPIISGAFQQLRGLPFAIISIGTLMVVAFNFVFLLPVEVFSFGKGFEEAIQNAKEMKKMRRKRAIQCCWASWLMMRRVQLDGDNLQVRSFFLIPRIFDPLTPHL